MGVNCLPALGSWVFLICVQLLGALAAAGPAEGQAEALLDFRAGLQVGALPSWQGANPCSKASKWAGVTCSQRGEVTSIDLSSAGLSGTLSPGLRRLASLQELRLSRNMLRGQVPAEWGLLGNLQKLYLDDNVLEGTLPPTWGSLPAIKYLNCANNRLSGPLPLSWGSMADNRVYLINLSGNQLQGTLPSTWGQQGHLLHLRLAANAFTDSLPPEWSRMQRLLTLDVSKNRLTGILPASYRSLSQVTLLDFSSNSITGPLPGAWGLLASLQILALQNNQLSGLIPQVDWNSLASRIYSISLSNNSAICGDVPDSLSAAISPSQRRLTSLGRPCPWQGDAEALMHFKSAATDPRQALQNWQWDSNPCGVPGWRGVQCKAEGRITALNLTGVGLTGKLKPLAGLGRLELLDISHNAFPGPLFTGLVGLRRLRHLYLSHIGAEGELPASWEGMLALTSLSFSGNGEIMGSLPPGWGKLNALQALDLSGLRLGGPLPSQWSGMQVLSMLDLSSNELEGPIPSTWAAWKSIHEIHLGNNLGLCGSIPNWRSGTLLTGSNTNLHQSCLLTHASGLVVGLVFGVAVIASIACALAIGAIVVYLRSTRSTLRSVLQERSRLSLASFLSTNNYGPASSYIFHPKHAPHGWDRGLPTKAPQSPQPTSAFDWQLAIYTSERGQELLARRGGYRHLGRTQSDSTYRETELPARNSGGSFV